MSIKTLLQKFKTFFKKENLIIFFVVLVTFSFIFSNFLMISYLKNQKKSQRINLDDLKNLTKREIISYIKFKQKEARPLNFLNYIYFLMILVSYLSGIVTSYLFLKSRKGQCENRNIKKSREDILTIFPIKYRKVIEELIKSNGQESQSILRQKLGLDKVQMTRLIKRMEEEGFVIVKRGSKINYIELNGKLKELFRLEN